MPGMHLKQLGFTYSACGPFTKNKERIKKFMQTGYTSYIYRNDLYKACIQHNMAYGKYKDLERRTESDIVLKDKAFEIANNPKYDRYQRELASMVYTFFDKKSKGSGIKYMPNQQLANELHKAFIRKFKKKCVFILGVNLADVQLISKYNKEIKYLLCVFDLLSKNAWVVPLKDKKGVNITNVFKIILGNSEKKTK